MTDERAPPGGRGLTLRELEVVLHLLHGKSPKQIAGTLGVSLSSVRKHIIAVATTLPQNGAHPQSLVLSYAERLLARQPDVVGQILTSIQRARR